MITFIAAVVQPLACNQRQLKTLKNGHVIASLKFCALNLIKEILYTWIHHLSIVSIGNSEVVC